MLTYNDAFNIQDVTASVPLQISRHINLLRVPQALELPSHPPPATPSHYIAESQRDNVLLFQIGVLTAVLCCVKIAARLMKIQNIAKRFSEKW